MPFFLGNRVFTTPLRSCILNCGFSYGQPGRTVPLLSQSGSTAKVAVTTHFVEAVSNSATDTYLVSLIRRRWYVSALGNVGANLG